MTPSEFRTQVLQLFYQDMHRIVQDNYSHRRFSYDGIDRSRQFDVGKHVMFMNWFLESHEEIFKAWSRLSDQASRDLYIDLVRYRLAGHLHVKIRTAVHVSSSGSAKVPRRAQRLALGDGAFGYVRSARAL